MAQQKRHQFSGILSGATSTFSRAMAIAGASTRLVTNILGHTNRLVNDVLLDSLAIAREAEALSVLAVDHARSVQQMIRVTPRFAKIVSEGVKIIAAYRLFETRAAFCRNDEERQQLLEQLHQKSAFRLYELCVSLRGGMIKLGQFISTRQDMLPAPYIEWLSKLQDRVPPIPTGEIVAQLELGLGRPVDQLFAHFDAEPIAAASLAQVHRAVLHDGQHVVVKVQLPGIGEIVEIDLAAFDVLVGLVGQLFPQIRPGMIATAIGASVQRELDYESEAQNLTAFAERCQGRDDVVLPGLFSDYCSKTVLTMTELEGEPILEFLNRSTEALDRPPIDQLLTILVKSVAEQILEWGVVHADPHPGNFLVLEGPRLGLLDFGAVEYLNSETRDAIRELIGVLATRDVDRLGQILVRLGMLDEAHVDSFRGVAEPVVEALQRQLLGSLTEIDLKAEIELARQLFHRLPPLDIPQELVLVGRVLFSISGLLLHYRPQIDLFAVIMPLMAPPANVSAA